MPPTPHLSNRLSGASLIDVMFAISLVAFASAALFLLYSNALHLLQSQQETEAATFCLQERAEEIRSSNWAVLTNSAKLSTLLNQVPASASLLPGLVEDLTVSVYPPATGTPQTLHLQRALGAVAVVSSNTTLLTSRILRVDLRATWQGNGRSHLRENTLLLAAWGLGAVNKLASKRGFTLSEMMVAMAVGSAMLGGLLITSTNLQSWFASADYAIGCQQDESTTFDYLARDIRRASAAVVQNGDLKLTLTLPDQTVRAADGTLQPPAIQGVSSLKYGTAPLTVSYFVQGDSFLRQDSNGGSTTLSTNINEFHANVSTPPAVGLRLVFKAAPHRMAGVQASTTVNLRNLATRLQ